MRATLAAGTAIVLCAAGCMSPEPVSAPAEDHLPITYYTSNMPSFAPNTPFVGTWSADAEKFTFVVIGDVDGAEPDDWSVFDRIADEVSRLRPDFAILLGDLIDGGGGDSTRVGFQWRRFRRHADRLRVPYLMLPGECDVGDPVGQAWWHSNIGRTYYSFEYRGCLFVALNSQEVASQTAGFGEEQLRFAREAILSAPDARHIFLLMHQPAWVSATDEWREIGRAVGDRECTVFAAHRHHLQFETHGGHRFFMLGSSRKRFAAGGAREQGKFAHYTHVTVQDDSAYVAIIEPGSVWREDVAPVGYEHRIARVVNRGSDNVRSLQGGVIAVDAGVSFHNPFQDALEIGISVRSSSNWRPTQEFIAVSVPPGGDFHPELSFIGRSDSRVPVPAMFVTARYGGRRLMEWGPLTVEPFADADNRRISTWRVRGPEPAGEVDPERLAGDVRSAIPILYDDSASDTTRGRWSSVRADPGGDGSAFENLFSGETYRFGCARGSIRSSATDEISVKLVAGGHATMSVNDSLAVDYHSPDGEARYVTVRLREGLNTVEVRMVNEVAPWDFDLVFLDVEGMLIDDE